MNVPRAINHRLLAAADRLYRALLLTCPPSFRRAYGAEMAQVFRTCCREALNRGGALAVMRLWLRTLGDLTVTAFIEHTRGGGSMSRAALMRLSGLAGIAGGALWLALLVIEYGLSFSGNQAVSMSLYYYGDQSLWLLFGVALIGLHLRLAITPRWLGAIMLAISLVGVAALLVGNMGMGFIWIHNSGPVIDLSAPRPAIMRFSTQLYMAAFMGYLVLGFGMLLYGVVAVARRALPRYNNLVLVTGILVVLQYFFTDMGAPSLLRNTGTPGVLVMAGENIVFLLVWSIGWILIGRLLWTENHDVAPAPALPSA